MRKMKLKKSIAISAIAALLSLLVLLTGATAAHAAEGTGDAKANAEIKQGIMPDSFLYGIQTAIDRINLALTFDHSEKAEKGLKIAKKRLLEVQEMLSEDKLAAAQKAQREHDRTLANVENSIRKLSRSDARAEANDEVRLEKALEEHGIEVDTVRGNFEARMKIKGEATAEQQALIDSILDSLQNKTNDARISIENKRGETKAKIKLKEGKSEKEIELEIKGLEERNGLLELKRERAQDRINDAGEKLAEAKAKLQQLSANATSNVTANIAAVSQLVSEAEIRLQSARQAFNESKFGEAFGQATAAERLARNAERAIERPLFAVDDDLDRRGGEEQLRITAKVSNSSSQVKLEVRFTTLSINQPAALDELVSRITNLSKVEIDRLLETENEEEELRERLRNEIRVREGLARVRLELEFPLNASERQAIVDGIFSRLSSLTRADLERALAADIREAEENDEAEREIEVEVEDGIARVKVEVGGSASRFSVPFTNETSLLSSIAEKTGLTLAEVSSVTRIKPEENRKEAKENGKAAEAGQGFRGKAEAAKPMIAGLEFKGIFNFGQA